MSDSLRQVLLYLVEKVTRPSTKNKFDMSNKLTASGCGWFLIYAYTVKPCVKQPLSKRPKNCFQYQLKLNAGQKYCRILQLEHSAILSTFIKLRIVMKIFVLSIFEWLFNTGLTV